METKKKIFRKVFLSEIINDEEFINIKESDFEDPDSYISIILKCIHDILKDESCERLTLYLEDACLEWRSLESDEEFEKRKLNEERIKEVQDKFNIQKMKQLMDLYKDIAKKYLKDE